MKENKFEYDFGGPIDVLYRLISLMHLLNDLQGGNSEELILSRRGQDGLRFVFTFIEDSLTQISTSLEKGESLF